MEFDFLTLSRIQFAFTIAFHYLFSPLNIGLGLILVFMEGMYLRTGNKTYEAMAKFWTKLFGVTFAVGVASGIVMEFQFGTNWDRYARFVGDVFGSALAAEGIFAFFLESGFLAILVFGWDRFSPKVHFFATCMVCLGSIFSAVWIIVANSWQQTPAGFHIMNGRAEITDFWALVFNPSSMIRLAHTLLGAFTLGSCFVLSVSSYFVLKNRHADFAKRSISIALVVSAIVTILQPFVGHIHAQNVAVHQPPKLAAMEGIYKTTPAGTDMSLFGFPDDKSETIMFKIPMPIPGFLSWLAYGDFNKPVPGLDAVAPDMRPPVALTYIAFHIMVALGFLFIAANLWGLISLKRGNLWNQRWLLRYFTISIILAYAANHLGWVVTEVGRQPWLVWGLQLTKDGVSTNVPLSHGIFSLSMFVVIYTLLFLIWVFVLNKKIHTGPDLVDSEPDVMREHGGRKWTA